MRITKKRRGFINHIKEDVFKDKIHTIEQLLYLEKKRHELFPQKELVEMVEIAIEEYAKEMGWELEYAIAHSRINYIVKGEEK